MRYFVSNYKDKKITKKFYDTRLLSQRLYMSIEDIKMVLPSLRTSMSREFKRIQKILPVSSSWRSLLSFLRQLEDKLQETLQIVTPYQCICDARNSAVVRQAARKIAYYNTTLSQTTHIDADHISENIM